MVRCKECGTELARVREQYNDLESEPAIAEYINRFNMSMELWEKNQSAHSPVLFYFISVLYLIAAGIITFYEIIDGLNDEIGRREGFFQCIDWEATDLLPILYLFLLGLWVAYEKSSEGNTPDDSLVWSIICYIGYFLIPYDIFDRAIRCMVAVTPYSILVGIAFKTNNDTLMGILSIVFPILVFFALKIVISKVKKKKKAAQEGRKNAERCISELVRMSENDLIALDEKYPKTFALDEEKQQIADAIIQSPLLKME